MEHCKEAAKNKCAGAYMCQQDIFPSCQRKMKTSCRKNMYKLCHRYILKHITSGPFLVVQRLLMQGARVQSLVRESDPLCCKSEPVCHSEIPARRVTKTQLSQIHAKILLKMCILCYLLLRKSTHQKQK